jgi:thiol-disulfide isomerase/thioredoxin
MKWLLWLAVAAGAAAQVPPARSIDPRDFTLTAVDGDKLNLATLKGKVVVFEFWATWCAPCREQHPLYERVMQRFEDRPDVVFVSINADEDRGLVRPFLQAEKWREKVYFDEGLARAFRVVEFPTTLLMDRRGKLYSRTNGYIGERFAETLTGRIKAMLAN